MSKNLISFTTRFGNSTRGNKEGIQPISQDKVKNENDCTSCEEGQSRRSVEFLQNRISPDICVVVEEVNTVNKLINKSRKFYNLKLTQEDRR